VRGSSRTVVSVDPRTWNSGATLLEMVPLPLWILVLYRTARWLVLHPVLTGSAALWCYAAVVLNGAMANVLTLVGLAVVTTVRLYWAARSCSYAGPRQAVRSLLYLHRVRRGWKEASENALLTSRLSGRPAPLRKVRATVGNVGMNVHLGAIGRTSREMLAAAETYAACFRADAVSVDAMAPGLARVTLSWGDPTSRVLTLKDLPQQTPGLAAFALNPDSKPVHLSLDTSVLIVGESGSGKSNIVWALLAALNEQKVPYRLRVIDPAGGVELSSLDGGIHTRFYTDKARDVDSMIKVARDAMQTRLSFMKKAGIRKHVASAEEPMDITIIDEVLLLSQQIKEGAISPLGELLSVGRKANFKVWALSQLGQVDALGRIRDLFPQRICLATKSREMTEAVLGPSAEAQGAACSKIPRQTPGVGYLYLDGQRGFRRFRSVLVTDEETELIAQGKPPREIVEEQQSRFDEKEKLASRRTAVYRLRDKEGRLLYVGITVNPNIRFGEHAAEKPWWSAVDMGATKIEWYKNRALAKAAETKAIQTENPIYNVDEAVLVGDKK
jgi:predicted GIY-YIG superfamily endonuclease